MELIINCKILAKTQKINLVLMFFCVKNYFQTILINNAINEVTKE
jgi:hypothetical protein